MILLSCHASWLQSHGARRVLTCVPVQVMATVRYCAAPDFILVLLIVNNYLLTYLLTYVLTVSLQQRLSFSLFSSVCCGNIVQCCMCFFLFILTMGFGCLLYMKIKIDWLIDYWKKYACTRVLYRNMAHNDSDLNDDGDALIGLETVDWTFQTERFKISFYHLWVSRRFKPNRNRPLANCDTN